MSIWYRTGTVSVANGSASVTGTTTAWTAQAKSGDRITFDGGDRWYEIDTVNSNTSITLATNFAGTTVSGGAYAIDRSSPKWTMASDLATQIAALLASSTHILQGDTAPSNALGADGDFYLMRTPVTLYGPKASGTWPSGIALGGDHYTGTSTTSNAIGTGSKTFSVSVDLAHVVGGRVRFSADATHWVEGAITAYAAGSMTVDVDKTSGSGTFTSWSLSVAGQPGADGVSYGGTSTTSNAIGTGSKTWVTSSVLGYTVGSRVRFSADATHWAEGVVTAYATGSITVTVDKTLGTGTFTSWSLSVAGEPGLDGVGTGDVTAASAFAAVNRIVRAAGTTKGVKDSPASIDDSGNATGLGYLEVARATAPSSAAAGKLRLYAKTDGKLATKDESGVEVVFGSGGGGTAAYINNLTLVPTVSSNALTVSLKTAAGSDPSAADPIVAAFRSATLTSGSYDQVSLQAALSVTVPAGSTFAVANNAPFKLHVGLVNDGGTLRLALIQCVSGTSVAPICDDKLISATNIGTPTTAQAWHSTATVTSKAFRYLGYLEWSSGLSTSGNYASTPTKVQLFGPGVPLPGSIIQTVVTRKSDTFTTSSTTYVDLTGMSASPTLQSAANICRIQATIAGSNSSGDARWLFNLLRGSTAIGVGDTAGSRSSATMGGPVTNEIYNISSSSCDVMDAPGTASPTYKFQVKTDALVYINRSQNDADSAAYGRVASSMTVTEIAA